MLLGGVIVALLVAGVAVAAIQPGDLGDEEETSAPSTTVTRAPATSATRGTTATTAASGTTATTSGAAGATSTSSTAPATTGTTVAPPTTTFASTTSTTSAGGLGSEGAGQVTDPGEPLANTGGEVPMGLAAALLFLGLALAAVRARLG